MTGVNTGRMVLGNWPSATIGTLTKPKGICNGTLR